MCVDCQNKMRDQETCPFFNNGTCEIASEIAGVPCSVSHETCIACSLGTERSRRLNAITLSVAYGYNRNIDISRIQSVIDGTSNGFGTRLANTLGYLFREISGCKCKGHQDILDVWTKEYISKNMDKVLDWLQNEAKTRRIPFSRALTRVLLNGLLLPPDPPQPTSEKETSHPSEGNK